MTVKPDQGTALPSLAERTAKAQQLVDHFCADLRLACETRPYSDEFAEGLASRYFTANAVLLPVGALVYAVRAYEAAKRERWADPQPDCVNTWGVAWAPSCKEQDYLELEQAARTQLVETLLRGPWPI